MLDDLAVCPCGQVPEKLCVQEGSQGYKWGLVNGYCCGEWNIEFRTNYTKNRLRGKQSAGARGVECCAARKG